MHQQEACGIKTTSVSACFSKKPHSERHLMRLGAKHCPRRSDPGFPSEVEVTRQVPGKLPQGVAGCRTVALKSRVVPRHATTRMGLDQCPLLQSLSLAYRRLSRSPPKTKPVCPVTNDITSISRKTTFLSFSFLAKPVLYPRPRLQTSAPYV